MPLALACALLAAAAPAAAVSHYTLRATIDPTSHRIVVEGTLKGLDGTESPVKTDATIHHPISREGEDYARGFGETRGTIGLEGVFLSGSSGWYEKNEEGLLTFDLEVVLPAGWSAMSQGQRELLERSPERARFRFKASDPQEEIWLVAGPSVETARSEGGTELLALLREDDPPLAARYLDATGPYLAMYAKLLGPYPYSKFALVENFWETGYGMPSFTLLGTKVLRLPFILTTSYPPEILHNWWGNGVYVDPAGGTWSEGLTAYLADHLFSEQKGGGAAYRQATLQKYTDYAARSKDFPLAQFRERHSPSTEAVGYGKALMLFHMLRREIGDEAFVKGLRSFYADHRFRRAGWSDLRRAFERAAGRDFSTWRGAWIERAGAPRLRLRDVKVETRPDGTWRLRGALEQGQDGAPYALAVPVAVTLEGRERAFRTVIRADERIARFDFDLPVKPVRVDVDPEFDLFRVLDVEEAPPALSGAFGADVVTAVLPAAAPPDLLAAYRLMLDEWNRGRTQPMTIAVDAALKALPAGSVWIVGFENRFVPEAAAALQPHGTKPDREGDRAVVAVARRAAGAAPVMAFVAADHAAQVPGLGRKLPHYHKYSFLAFEGDEPVNVVKARWPVTGSPLTVLLEGTPAMGTLAPRAALAELPPSFSKERMAATVRALSAPEMGGRGVGSPGIDRAAASIAAAMKDAGLEVLPVDPTTANVVGVLRGTKPDWASQSVVVGAHYDHLGTAADGAVRPGADDNASGVAVLLELARRMAASGRPPRTVVFAAFTGEETGLQGSKRYVAAASTWPAAQAIGMVNLDTVGRLGAGKILVLGAGTADEWIHIVNGAGYVTGAPVQAVMDDPGGSDQASFVAIGVPAVQLFTGAHADYHQVGDTADKIDAEGLVKVAAVARELVAYLSERDGPLTSKLRAGSAAAPPQASGERRVSLGTIPDYAFPGPGVRISGTTAGSPAEAAGLRSGDVLLEIDGASIGSMRDLSDALKTRAAGTKIAVTFRRDGKTLTTEATLVAR